MNDRNVAEGRDARRGDARAENDRRDAGSAPVPDPSLEPVADPLHDPDPDETQVHHDDQSEKQAHRHDVSGQKNCESVGRVAKIETSRQVGV